MNLSLIIFDMDGTLVNTEMHYREVNHRLFAELGFTLPEAEHDAFVGTTAQHMWSTLKSRYHLNESVETLMAQEEQAHLKQFQHVELSPIAGVEEWLKTIQQQSIPVAIGSSSSPLMIEQVLQQAGLTPYFEHCFSGHNVEKGKPAPDLFLAVAKFFKVAPEHCLVIEDSAHGVTAAKAAGMTCWAYKNPHSGAQDLSQADFVFSDYANARKKALHFLSKYAAVKSPELLAQTGKPTE